MAGLYIHIPFCHKACTYCDFHFTTSLRYRDRMLQCILDEIELRKSELEQIDTVYFGGGTPSILNEMELDRILSKIKDCFELNKSAEITIEANPEDISSEIVASWKSLGINRLSLGVQSFNDDDLEWMNRGHISADSKKAIEILIEGGIENISADLIFGLPNQDIEKWQLNLESIIQFPISHLSIYSLTNEPKTALAHQVSKGLISIGDDNTMANQFEMAQNILSDNGFEQYEISNYAKKGYISKHNSSYWREAKYIGIGPSAHSYDGLNRRWNLANNQKYMKGLENDQDFFESEMLSKNDRFNEYVLTRLRTKWGCDLNYIRDEFGLELNEHPEIIKQISLKTVVLKDDHIYLTKKAMMLADHISSNLFLV